MDTNDILLERAIRNGLTTTFIGQKMNLLPTIHSTNQYLKELDAAVDNGFVVIADEQTDGRGRRNKTFASPKGEGIYLSILLKLSGLQQDVRLLTICAAAAVSKAIEKSCGIRADIKWVNDIYWNGKKMCGILAEAITPPESRGLCAAIVGIGINTGAVPAELADIATSIREASGMRGIRNRLIAEVLNQFEAAYLDYTENEKWADILKYYKDRLFIVGKQILVADATRQYSATVLGVDAAGALIVRDDCGDIQHLTTGEIKLL